jgi:membrane protein implicated in regulation of membrane protease activity
LAKIIREQGVASYIEWFLFALVLLGVEMATGTFYLLVLAIAMAVGGAAALFGLGMAAQLVLAALAGMVGMIFLRRWKGGRARDAVSQSLDTGHPVRVLTWREDGTVRVFYRGAEWDAKLETPDSGHEEPLYIKEIRGSVLILTHRKPVLF